ncbi:K(+)-transporting ATPase subunit F [Streptomyces sedi]|uniref:K(+)-transporting ATPase subunit F n=1 Tax=Streptomyces sedi TaxID=555059 RepID=A0A5C4V2A6_9ACTN|nr:K(+)-transporting ATPase subunit F [Streptomyces sedi]TNM29897.1 K(+)-transporting ATPase subunit F [Streptomyces sedi]
MSPQDIVGLVVAAALLVYLLAALLFAERF